MPTKTPIPYGYAGTYAGRVSTSPVARGQLASQENWEDVPGTDYQERVPFGTLGSWATPYYRLGAMFGRGIDRGAGAIGNIPGQPLGRLATSMAENPWLAGIVGALGGAGAGVGLSAFNGGSGLLQGGLGAGAGALGSYWLSNHLQNLAAQNAYNNAPMPRPKSGSVRTKKSEVDMAQVAVNHIPALYGGASLGVSGLAWHEILKQRKREKLREQVRSMLTKASTHDLSSNLNIAMPLAAGSSWLGAAIVSHRQRRREIEHQKDFDQIRSAILKDPELVQRLRSTVKTSAKKEPEFVVTRKFGLPIVKRPPGDKVERSSPDMGLAHEAARQVTKPRMKEKDFPPKDNLRVTRHPLGVVTVHRPPEEKRKGPDMELAFEAARQVNKPKETEKKSFHAPWEFPLDVSSPDLVTAALIPSIGQRVMLDSRLNQEQKLTLNSLLPQLNSSQAESLHSLIRRGIGASVGAIVAKYLFKMGLGGMTLFGIMGSMLAAPSSSPRNYNLTGQPF